MGVTASQPIYAVEDIPGKGRGLIATKDIAKGTRIISEKPIVSISQSGGNIEQLQLSMHQQVNSLREADKQEFLSMMNICPYNNSTEEWFGIVRTNALPMGPDLDAGGVFLHACRINHACDNNATNFWNENINQLTIHAIRDIRKGEEITISYLSSLRNRQARQEELLKNFKFTCSCRLCSLPPDQSRDRDAKLDRIHEIDGIIEQGGIEALVSAPRRMLGYVDEQIQLWSDMSPNEVGLGRAYPDAFQIAIANGDFARARIFAEKVVDLYLTTLGKDSPDVAQYKELFRDPTTHNYYGISMKWKTTVEDIPIEFDSQIFEGWLWKRRKPVTEGQLADFRDRETFPSFGGLPDQSGCESDYFDCGDIATRRPMHHWCFLAEVQDVFGFSPLHVVVKDVNGVVLPLLVHTSCPGEQISPSKIQKGYTLAILYAVRRISLFRKPFIHLEKPKMVKVGSSRREMSPSLTKTCRSFLYHLTDCKL
ncbi:uncharacterized protein N0V89_007860 [Didymosphaeria variabile]|uniref:SET domain-containing protein n=1 Tax=Didymosphaeria variabile TaxID=1932322 RepID=A0A9W9CB66_9PLEO|nr:uncharacterized protein N0V89_007860 [Didymosphaeria variabile]KAJ4352511.1 hypothetical protein N0V89_007860 [Didymosphaeria variabile]